MNDTCLGCFGSGRFSSGGTSYCGTGLEAVGTCSFSRTCNRCGGTGREPFDEIVYVQRLNARVQARTVRAA